MKLKLIENKIKIKKYFIHKNRYLFEFIFFCYTTSWILWGLLFFINKEKNTIFYYLFLYSGALTPGIFVLIRFKFIKNLLYKNKLKINFFLFLILSLIIPFFCFSFIYIIWFNLTYLNISYNTLFNKIFNKYYFMFIYSLLVAFITFFEEIGFRAFFQYNLKMNNIKKSIVGGFFWGLWHLPLNLTGYNFKNFPIIGNLIFIISCILISYITYFLLIYSKNIFICSSPVNYFINFFFSIPIFKVSLKRVLEIVNFDNEIYSDEFNEKIILESKHYRQKLIKMSRKTILNIKDNKYLKIINNFKEEKFINKICIRNEILKNNTNKNSYFRINNLNFSFNSDKYILKNINFKILSKGLLIISGESGSGKTTLCKILTGFYKNYEGEIYFKNKELKNWEVDKIRKRIVYMPQEHFLINGNLLENIFYGNNFDYFGYENVLNNNTNNNKKNLNTNRLKLFKSILSSREILNIILNDLKKKYPDIINSELNKFLNFLIETNYYKPEFSTGQAQRIAFIRVLLKQPEVLILDEPTSALDKENEKILLNIINKLKDSMSIIIVSHKSFWLNLTDNILKL